MKDNRASNATYLGPIIFGQIQPAHEDQYQPISPLFVEQEAEQDCKHCHGNGYADGCTGNCSPCDFCKGTGAQQKIREL